MTDAKDIPGSPPSLRPMVAFSREELDQMRANAEAWISDPKKLEADLKIDVLLVYQICRKIATNPPGGRSGVTAAVRSAQRVVEMAAELLDIARKREDPESDAQPQQPTKAVPKHPSARR